MCGRFTLTSDPASLHAQFGIRGVPFDYSARYNIAPTQPVLGLVSDPDGSWAPATFFWGAAPAARGGGRHINARAETVATLPAFRSAFRSRRCLVLADGFYEWRRDGDRKTPMYIRRIDARPFAFAGLWNEVREKDGTSHFTCTILTTRPNELMRPIHDRMPVILPPREYETWLAPDSRADVLLPLLGPADASLFEAYAVSSLVNSPQNDVPECIAPAEPAPLLRHDSPSGHSSPGNKKGR